MNNKIFLYKNTQISYTDSGSGSVLIFIHGFLENKELWKTTSSSFTKKNRVITLDLLGHGQSECLGYIHTMEDQADLIFSLISHLKIRRVTLIGHSMGGYVALAFAKHYTTNLKQLILVNSTATTDSEERIKNRKRAIEIIKKNPSTFISMATQNLFDDTFRSHNKEQILWFKNEALKTPIQGIIASIQGMIQRENLVYLFHSYKFKISCILGEKDIILPIHSIKKEIEDTEVNLQILNCGHIAPLETPLEVTKAINHFIK